MVKSVLLSFLFTASATALNNGVGKLPKLGFSTWNVFQCDYDADMILSQAQALVDHGLVEAGYDTMMIDDCYSLKERDSCGKIVADPKKFPNGMRNLTDTLKAMGLQAGIYSDAGYKTCGGYPGSYGHEAQDLKTFDEWGFHYLKYDNCFIPFDNVTQENGYGRYKRMADAIEERAKGANSTLFQLALCQWGWQQPWTWAGRLGQSWRVGGDIRPWWSALAGIINQASFIATETDFYSRNDFDMLEVGNTDQGTPPGNLTFDEAKSHFTAWALLKSPLLIGSDLTNASPETVEILGNKDILKISQDPNVGESIAPFRWGLNPDYTFDPVHPAAYWTGNSSYGVVFMVLNSLDTPQEMSFNLTESWAIRAGRVYSVYDMWSHTENGTVMRDMSFTLPPHGVAALLLNDAGPEPAGMEPYCAGYWQCSFPNGTYYSN
ncbi:putative alpha-galactosidase B [Phialemonium atrogriseum]|uniref:Alpha-galactosidase n=1 Tax=Phialemonium atrogriseum TaxID=1093897 RepID=A0AAJ0FC69_9PEZI|nr:putative alpha-galactosidase B [Phialemonium atrogriseum]KAK1763271.1 putative alpha-galactosidase B [Phialemonium atrogriseum]